jgi:transglutaminase-like putative cysteine protease
MITKIPKKLCTDELYDLLREKYLSRIIEYIIDSKYRKSVQLSSWIKNQVDNPSTELKEYADKLNLESKDYDEMIIEILRYVRQTFTYKKDDDVWNMPEYWNTGKGSVISKVGDCEDGAILIYLVARYKGIPANRMILLCGGVKGGGHCWLGYKPQEYPVNFVFIDWCYWANNKQVKDRNKFYIDKQKIIEYKVDGDTALIIPSDYYTLWFGFNELDGYRNLKYQIQ